MKTSQNRDVRPIRMVMPGPGTVQLEDDNRSPLQTEAQKIALALGRIGALEARNANLEIANGQLASVAAALIMMLEREPLVAHLVHDGMVVIPGDIAKRTEGAQIQAIETSDGDVGIVLRERAPELFVGRKVG